MNCGNCFVIMAAAAASEEHLRSFLPISIPTHEGRPTSLPCSQKSFVGQNMLPDKHSWTKSGNLGTQLLLIIQKNSEDIFNRNFANKCANWTFENYWWRPKHQTFSGFFEKYWWRQKKVFSYLRWDNSKIFWKLFQKFAGECKDFIRKLRNANKYLWQKNTSENSGSGKKYQLFPLIWNRCVCRRRTNKNNCINQAWPIKVNFVNDGGGNKSC